MKNDVEHSIIINVQFVKHDRVYRIDGFRVTVKNTNSG